ncbi:MAG: transketolase family protein [Conexivisphaera sp.]|nr:transketolase C-terminal domain-containing protein [Conexivisphaerales archaeon]
MSGRIATREAYGAALRDLGGEADFVVLDADLSHSTMTGLFAERFPRRFVNVGISEQNLLAVAAGLAYSGKIVFASTFAVFATKAWDLLRIIAHDGLDVRLAVSHGGLSNGPDGWSHQSVEDVAVMRAIPNFRVVVPADAVETREAVRAALSRGGPWYIRLSKLEVPVIFGDDYRFRLGMGLVLRDGEDVAILAYGVMLHEALRAAEALGKRGISAAVVDVHTVKPLDEDLVEALARRTGAIVTAEDANVIGGLGGAVAEALARRYPAPVEMIGVRDAFGRSGETRALYAEYGLTADAIEEGALRAVGRRGRGAA